MDPCKSIDPNAQDILELRVWLPTDSIELCASSELGVWKPPCGVCAKWWAPVFAMTFVSRNEGMAFESFGVN